MRMMIWSWRTVRRRLVSVGCVMMGVILLCFGQAAATGVKHGLAVCAQLLIPSLFPFMILADFFIRSGQANGLGRRLHRPMRTLCGFSGCAATALLISFLGGYPAGAVAVQQLLSRGDLDERSAARLLRCAVNGGPAFIIGGVGIGMLGSVKAGVLLLTAHWVASLLILLIEREPYTPSVSLAPSKPPRLSVAVTQSVHASTSALLSMCGFILAASTLLSLTDAVGGAHIIHAPWRCAFTALLEVTSGCMEAAVLGKTAPFWLGAALGFGGLSVHGQIAAVTGGRISLGIAFLRARLLHALLGGCLSMVLFLWFKPLPVAVSASTAMLSSFAQHNDTLGMTAIAAVLLLCVIFLQTLPSKRA